MSGKDALSGRVGVVSRITGAESNGPPRPPGTWAAFGPIAPTWSGSRPAVKIHSRRDNCMRPPEFNNEPVAQLSLKNYRLIPFLYGLSGDRMNGNFVIELSSERRVCMKR